MKVLALGNKDSVFYKSIASIESHFGELIFKSEHEFKSVHDLQPYLKDKKVSRVLMPNPYGNKKRLACYKKLKELKVEVICSDRGALPNTWFFDQGFNADSASYAYEEWNNLLSESDTEEVEKYILNLTNSDKTLEEQGERLGGKKLKERLELDGKKILFVPLQRPSDTVMKYFSGDVTSLNDFIDKISDIADRLENLGWVVILKKHPLEVDYLPPKSKNVKYIYDAAHIYDLIEASDAVMLINSGGGVLSMAWNKPVYHFGDAFYSIPDVNKKITSVNDAVEEITKGLVVDKIKVNQFFHHLISKVYSFADFQTQKINDKDGGFRNITKNINFNTLNINGIPKPLGRDKILVVTSVVPVPIYRGSQSRIDAVIKSLIKIGLEVGVVIMNTSFQNKKSIKIEEEIRIKYPNISYVKVIRSPHFDTGFLNKSKLKKVKLIDNLFNKNKASKDADTPAKFRRIVKNAVTTFKPNSILVNYVKLSALIPDDFLGEKIIDTHDYQSQFLEEELQQNGNPKSINIEEFRASEFSLLNQYDKVIAINKNEKKIFSENITSKTFCVPAFYEANNNSYMLGHSQDAIFIGSISTFNVSGLLWFLNNVLPMILIQKKDFSMVVAGDVCRSPSIEKEKYKNVKFLGRVGDLSNYYHTSKVVVAPILAGAGMKIKVIEAISQGKMVIGTKKAFDGIDMVDGKSALINDNPEIFAKNVLLAIEDSKYRKSMEEQSFNFYQMNHSDTSIEKSLSDMLES